MVSSFLWVFLRIYFGYHETSDTFTCHLTAGLRSENCITRQFCHAKIIECTNTNLDSRACGTPRLSGTFYFSEATCPHSMALYKTTTIKSSTGGNEEIKRRGNQEMYEAAAGNHSVLLHSKIILYK